MDTIWQVDEEYWQQDIIIAGVDEVGRGCLSGPVIAAAFIADVEGPHPAVRDSKKISARKRDELYKELVGNARDYAVGLASAQEVDDLNVLEATRLAMARALRSLTEQPDLVLVDGVSLIESHLPQRSIVKGDEKIGSIAAASIIAKVTRDTLMTKLHLSYPVYKFASNKGYGTVEHLAALEKWGPCPLHRRSFNRVYQPRLIT